MDDDKRTPFSPDKDDDTPLGDTNELSDAQEGAPLEDEEPQAPDGTDE